MNINTAKAHYKCTFMSWFLFDFCLPILFIVGFWPAAAWLLKLPYAYEQVFSSAELIPVGSLLMLSTSREIDMERRMDRITHDLDLLKQIGIFVPIVMLSVYSILKYYSMTFIFPTEPTQTLDGVISIIPTFSFAVIFLAGCYCFMAKWKIIDSLK